MFNSHTTQFLFDDGEFFAAHTSDGGARVGMNNIVAFQVPADHAMYAQVLGLTAETAEEFIDSLIESGLIPLSAFKR